MRSTVVKVLQVVRGFLILCFNIMHCEDNNRGALVFVLPFQSQYRYVNDHQLV